jgi:hypothetical protein
MNKFIDRHSAECGYVVGVIIGIVAGIHITTTWVDLYGTDKCPQCIQKESTGQTDNEDG